MTGQQVLVLNGANLGRLGTREPEIYGTTSYADLVKRCTETAAALGIAIDMRQTDAEAELLGWLHEAADRQLPVVLNPGAWTHYSWAIRDACAALSAPLLEVHLSNVHAREEFRRTSVISPVATGVICGLGVAGYEIALRWLVQYAE